MAMAIEACFIVAHNNPPVLLFTSKVLKYFDGGNYFQPQSFNLFKTDLVNI